MASGDVVNPVGVWMLVTHLCFEKARSWKSTAGVPRLCRRSFADQGECRGICDEDGECDQTQLLGVWTEALREDRRGHSL